eukprot:gene20977-biopygen13156
MPVAFAPVQYRRHTVPPVPIRSVPRTTRTLAGVRPLLHPTRAAGRRGAVSLAPCRVAAARPVQTRARRSGPGPVQGGAGAGAGAGVGAGAGAGGAGAGARAGARAGAG